MTDKQLRYINRLTVLVRKLLKLVPQEKREELENEFDSILLDIAEPDIGIKYNLVKLAQIRSDKT